MGGFGKWVFVILVKEKKMEGEDRIEESSSVRLLGGSWSGSESRWVDGSEVDSESPPWSQFDDEKEEGKEGFGSLRRRLVKKPKRVDSFDVEALEISGARGHHSKVTIIQYNHCFLDCNFPNLLFLSVFE